MEQKSLIREDAKILKGKFAKIKNSTKTTIKKYRDKLKLKSLNKAQSSSYECR